MRIFLIVISIVFVSFFLADRLWSEEAPVDVFSDLMKKGVKAYQAGDPVQCLKFLQQGIDLDPSAPGGHFMYGSFAYQIALDLKQQFAEKEMNLTALAAMQELSLAIQLGKDYKGDNPEVKNMTGHAAFLMGDLFHYIYNQPEMAWDFFEFARTYWPDDPDLIRETKVVGAKIPKDYVAQPLQEYHFSLDVLKRVTNPK